jgi:hypothetical protein
VKEPFNPLGIGVPIPDPSSRPLYPGIWTHSKGGEYRILGFGVIEQGVVPSVIYQSVKDGSVWIRPCSNFFDGRFKPEIS